HPDLLAREYVRRVAIVRGLVAVRDDRRPGDAHVEHIQEGRRLRERHLLMENELLHEREAAAAVLLWPREADEARVVELALPLSEELVGLQARDLGAPEMLPLVGDVFFEPGADGLAERLLLRSQREVHFPS